jgi:hypothetical protein
MSGMEDMVARDIFEMSNGSPGRVSMQVHITLAHPVEGRKEEREEGRQSRQSKEGRTYVNGRKRG